MSVEEDILNTLQLSNDLDDLVADRIYPILPPQRASFPYITYTVLSTEGDHTHSGRGNGDRHSVEVRIVAESFFSAKEVSVVVQDALDTNGILDGSSERGVFLLDDEHHIAEYTKSGSDEALVVIIQTYTVLLN